MFRNGFSSAGLFADEFSWLTNLLTESAVTRGGTSAIALNIFEAPERYILEAELPGISENELEIVVNDRDVTLRVTAVVDEKSESYTPIRKERARGAAERTIRLPLSLDAAKVDAELKNGILTVLLPKAEGAKPKKIQISVH